MLNDQVYVDLSNIAWQEWKDLALKARDADREQYHTHQDRVEALWRTIVRDLAPGTRHQRADSSSGKDFESLISAFGESENSDARQRDASAQLYDWLNKHGARITGRKLFRTRRGYLGMSCRHVLPGDKVYILWGGSLPFILREMGLVVLDPEANEPSKTVMSHVLIGGECYIHGLADGQGIDIVERESLEPGEVSII